MKHAVSISIGSSRRDKSVEINICGEKVCIERIGTDGDLEKAAQMYTDLDGNVDALGVGGGVLGLMVGERWYPMHSLLPLVKNVRRTPLVDGTGLKMTLEHQAVLETDRQLSQYLPNRDALVMTAVDRWGMAKGALDAGYRVTFGDLLYAMGIPVPMYREKTVHLLAALVAPIMTRLPFRWVYPIGEAQNHRKPTFVQYFQRAGTILGDCHYIWKYMPERLDGKTVITNTTTQDDVEAFRQAGVRFLVTTTPVFDGRSFGTNMMEAAIVAAAGYREPIDYSRPGHYLAWLRDMVKQLDLCPQIQELNP
ncbi:MAG: quinate 5-dehydrogenase [Chloroflexi bacterium]|nr:MAG: quinate 5-dehydrogenase [Chloroflexota bacterium]